jgi:XTP/dITP diphosphohydrolase
MEQKQIIIATGNQGKFREFLEILADLPCILTSLRDHWDPVPEIPETGATFLENARLKADWVFERTGLWSLADDSGLEVDALGGRPGVLSARFSGENATGETNNRKLLDELKNTPAVERTARFRCVLVLKTGSTQYFQVEGTCEGTIGHTPHGEGGFGYDPLFIPSGFERTFAELDRAVKHRISHRGKAMLSLREVLNDFIREK